MTKLRLGRLLMWLLVSEYDTASDGRGGMHMHIAFRRFVPNWLADRLMQEAR
jgi:hypothetical protein